MDWWSGQKQADVSIAAFIAKVAAWRPVKWAREGGPIDKALTPAINRAMRESNTFVTLETFPSIQNKAIRLESFHARWCAGSIYLPTKRPWAQRLIDQLVSFPAGRYDDMCDTVGLFGRMIDQMFDAELPVVDRKPDLVPFTEKWLTFKDDSEEPVVQYRS